MRLEWDKEGQRLYETGVKNAVIYPAGTGEAAGTFPMGYVWNGISSVSESPSGAEANPIYADDMKYLELRSAEEFGATIEAYMYPEKFAECDGSASIASGVMIGQQTRKRFGLSYRTILGNDTEIDSYGYKLHLIYNAMASPSERQYQTVNDSPEAISFSWEMTTTPIAVPGYKPTSTLIIDSTTADPTKLAALEDILYGTDNTDPRLPLPAEVLSIMGGESTVEIDLSRANLKLTEGQTYTLKATTVPAGQTVTYTSDATSYATVDSSTGKVTAVAAGTAKITATITVDSVDYTDTCNVVVVSA